MSPTDIISAIVIVSLIAWYTVKKLGLVVLVGMITTIAFTLPFMMKSPYASVIGSILVILFFIPPVSFIIQGIVLSPFMFILYIATHIYTVVVAWQEIWWKGVVTIFLPVISEIYWFISISKDNGSINNTYCYVIAAVAYIWIYEKFLLPFVLVSTSSDIRKITDKEE